MPLRLLQLKQGPPKLLGARKIPFSFLLLFLRGFKSRAFYSVIMQRAILAFIFGAFLATSGAQSKNGANGATA
jgi:hypothetical protein